jgi:hypothetical protein
MFRELVEFPNHVKVTERSFEAMLKDIRKFTNSSHSHLSGIVDYFNRLELKAKWGIKKVSRSGKPGLKYKFKFPHVIIKGSIMKWRYPTPNTPFGLPVCATLTRGFWTELQNCKLGNSDDFKLDTKKLETRYMIGEEGANTIIINPQATSQKERNPDIPKSKKIPSLIFENPDSADDTEIRQLFDCLSESREELPTRCLAILFRAARVQKFLDPLACASLVDQCMDMLEVYEKEGTFNFAFFKAMLLYHTDVATLQTSETCLAGVDVDAVMEMMGLPLSAEESLESRYSSPITRPN